MIETATQSSLARKKKKPDIVPWIFLAPYLALFSVFIAYPIGLGAWISLHAWDFTLPRRPFVGLGNYEKLFTPGSTTFEPFWQSMVNTGIFTIASTPLLLAIPLLVALVMNQNFKGRNLFRAIYFAPYVLGVAVITILWRYLLDNNFGLMNYLLDLVGLPSDTAWLTSLPAVWVSLVGVTVWWTLGFNSVIYLAALQDIPKELYEAATVDGANGMQKFRHVTMPGLKPIFAYITLLTLIASANMFGQSYLMTQGGPGTATRTAIYQITETGLRNFKMGDASAMSFVLTFFLLLLSTVVFFGLREKKDAKS
jgi:multiple sugar transport system permease protein